MLISLPDELSYIDKKLGSKKLDANLAAKLDPDEVITCSIFDMQCEKFGIHNWLDDILHQRIPETIHSSTTSGYFDYTHGCDQKDGFYIPELDNNVYHFAPFYVRHLCIRFAGFALISQDVLYPMADYIRKITGKENPTVLELGCGCGSWAYGMRSVGFKVIACDNYFKTYGAFREDRSTWINNSWINDTHIMSAQTAIREYGKDVDCIFMSWPDYNGDCEEWIYTIKDVNPDLPIIYIGEWDGGCTATDEFFENIYEVGYNTMSNVNAVYYDNNQWESIHDYFYHIKASK